ncbi:MAG: AAA family ATPase [Nitrospinota bacterium]|nr:AAA family ATPase [Nitrospinota bacterium]
MARPQLRKIEIQGFRSFGSGKQSFELSQTVSVLWGGNSQGKTSLAEAIEFLFSGQIARRELLASTKDEFSDSLRNAHIPNTLPVFVSAEIVCADGKIRQLKRVLSEDYKKGNHGCISTLEIDGLLCLDGDIETKLGIKLFQAPLSSPVLAQHTLGYIFSAGPNDRSTYFRAVLDTQDLEDFRAAIAALSEYIPTPVLKENGLLHAIEIIPELGNTSSAIRKSKSLSNLENSLLDATTALLTSLGLNPQDQLAAQAIQIEEELIKRRAKSFPLDLFTKSSFVPWDKNSGSLDQHIKIFYEERAKIDVETRRLVDLFKMALLLPEASNEPEVANCPLCGTIDALTPKRIHAIREQVKDTEIYQAAEKDICQTLQAISTRLSSLTTALDSSLPKFILEQPQARRAKGFTVTRMRDLVNDAAMVTNWLVPTRQIIRASVTFRKSIIDAQTTINTVIDSLDIWNDKTSITRALDKVKSAQDVYAQSIDNYTQVAELLVGPLKSAVDQSTNTKGWEELAKLAHSPTALWNALVETATYEQKKKDLNRALKEIDAGNGRVADDKFADMSTEVKKWWDYLRPDETTFFDAVQRRSTKARRNIDIKVGLSATEDRSNPAFRNAVAVFSQSQLHCLGLSMFLARAVQAKTGFIVMDDPVLTSDDDFRPNFASTVIEGLLNEGVQSIILTQDHSSWKDIGHRWVHRDVAQFQIVCNNPLLGTEIRNQNDGLATMIARAQPFVKSHDLDQQKTGATQIRLSIERFGKEILVRKSRLDGNQIASITDYDGKNFGEFSNSVYALLTKDPAHPGKLKAAHSYVTPGAHDDTPPSSGKLSTALGDLKKMKRDYLDS